MRFRHCLLIVLILILSAVVCADTYSTFQTTQYYSANRQYFVEVNEKQKAALYRNLRRPQRLWTRPLPQLPEELLVTNDGSHFVIIDRYYGNNHDPKMPVILIFDEKGNEMSRYRLGEVANLSLVAATTSNSYWFGGAWFTPDEKSIVVQTIVPKVDWDSCLKNTPPEQDWTRCFESKPYEQLRFDLGTGKLLDRISMVKP